MRHYILSFFILFLPFLFTKAQPTSLSELQANPRAYVEKKAVETNLVQIEKQKEIISIQNAVQEIQKSISQEKNKSLKKQKQEELKSLHQSLGAKKKELGSCIKESKKYRALMNKSDKEILAALSAKADTTSVLAKTSKAKKNEVSTETSDQKPARKIGIPSYTTSEDPKSNPKERGTKEQANSIPVIPDVFQNNQRSIKLPCKLQTRESDAFKALSPEILFSHTPPEIKEYLKGLDYYKGYAFIGKEPGYTYLNLQIEIASEQALFHYGNLGKSFIVFKLVNGEEIRIINSRFDSGNINRDKKTTSFSGIYFIDKSAEKLLLSSEIDTMKLQMVTGYEIYTIYNVDFFKRQLECINSAN